LRRVRAANCQRCLPDNKREVKREFIVVGEFEQQGWRGSRDGRFRVLQTLWSGIWNSLGLWISLYLDIFDHPIVSLVAGRRELRCRIGIWDNGADGSPPRVGDGQRRKGHYTAAPASARCGRLGLERALTSVLVPEIQRSALVGPAANVAHPLGSTPPMERFQGVGDARDVTMLSNREGPMVSSIEMDGRQRTVEEPMGRRGLEGDGGGL
jgi:hypothetical protein